MMDDPTTANPQLNDKKIETAEKQLTLQQLEQIAKHAIPRPKSRHKSEVELAPVDGETIMDVGAVALEITEASVVPPMVSDAEIVRPESPPAFPLRPSASKFLDSADAYIQPQVIGVQSHSIPEELSEPQVLSGQIGPLSSPQPIIHLALWAILLVAAGLAGLLLFKSGLLNNWWQQLVANPIRHLSQP